MTWQPAAGLSPEFALVIACCAWPPDPSRTRRIHDAGRGIDWNRFLVAVKRHRVEGLVHHALVDAAIAAPRDVSDALKHRAGEIAITNLKFAGEAVRLDRLTTAAAVRATFFKGPTLAQLAYGSLVLKMAWDVDILVPPEQLCRAAEILVEAGYRQSIPAAEMGPAGLARWHDHCKESAWDNATLAIHVELHTRLVDNPRMLTGVSAWSSHQRVALSEGVSLPTLTPDELFAYLCVHGASSAWFRLKWLADLAALIAGCDEAEIDRLYDRSQELGADRAAAQALLLCNALFDTQISQRLRRSLQSDWANRYLVDSAIKLMDASPDFAEPTERRLGTLRIHLTQLLLMKGRRFKMSEILRQSASPHDRMRVPLPRSLDFVNLFLAPFRLAARLWRKAR